MTTRRFVTVLVSVGGSQGPENARYAVEGKYGDGVALADLPEGATTKTTVRFSIAGLCLPTWQYVFYVEVQEEQPTSRENSLAACRGRER